MSNIWQSPPFGASTILTGNASPFAAVPEWRYVRPRFKRLLKNLQLTPEQLSDGETKYRGVVSALNRTYWSVSNDTAHFELVGSWAKGTRVRPPSRLLKFLPADTAPRI